MKTSPLLLIVASAAGFLLAPTPLHADDASSGKLSPERLDELDKRGYFTPSFKAAVHDLVNAKEGIVQAKTGEKKLAKDLPDLQKQAEDLEAKVAALRTEAYKYDHPDEADFKVLQASLGDVKARTQDQLVLAQAYAWAYPTSPHQGEVAQDLQQLQKKQADEVQAQKDADAKRAADRASLLQRAQAHDLSLQEWKDFLQDMSQQDVLKYLGHPQAAGADFWIYRGDWTTDDITQQKVGLMLSFNGTRVNVVTEAPPQQ